MSGGGWAERTKRRSLNKQLSKQMLIQLSRENDEEDDGIDYKTRVKLTNTGSSLHNLFLGDEEVAANKRKKESIERLLNASSTSHSTFVEKPTEVSSSEEDATGPPRPLVRQRSMSDAGVYGRNDGDTFPSSEGSGGSGGGGDGADIVHTNNNRGPIRPDITRERSLSSAEKRGYLRKTTVAQGDAVWDEYQASKPFALQYLEKMENKMEEKARENYVPMFGGADKNETSTFKKRRGSKTLLNTSAKLVATVAKFKTTFSPKSRRKRISKEIQASEVDTEPKRKEVFNSVNMENPDRPKFVRSRRSIPFSGVKCDLLVCDGAKWILDPHVRDAPTFLKKEILIFPERIVLPIDTSTETCSHYVGQDEELGPIVVSWDITDVGVTAILWCEKGGMELVVDAAKFQNANKKNQLQLIHTAIVTEHGVSPDTEFKLPTGPKFVRDIGNFARNCCCTSLKFGVLYCKPGQVLEEDMFLNEHGSDEFEKFLLLLGDKVDLLGFSKFNGGLDVERGLTGTHSIFQNFHVPTIFADLSIMFHVSTYLPYSEKKQQQLQRKRHLGNDVVVLVFQERGCEPFNPSELLSHFNHVVVVVRLCDTGGYEVCVAHKIGVLENVPPYLPSPAHFTDRDQLSRWLLLKMINMERAAMFAPPFSGPLHRARRMELQMLVE